MVDQVREGAGLSFDTPVKPLNFDEALPSSRPALSENTKANQAAYGALLSGAEDIAAEFTRIKEELDREDASPRLDTIQSFLATDEDNARRKVVEDSFNDPEKPVEEKTRLLEGYLIERDRQENLSNIYANRIAAMDSEGESVEADSLRLDSSELLDQVLEAKRQEQLILNRHLASADADTANALLDFVEAVIPFSQIKAVANIQRDFEKAVAGDISLQRDIVNTFMTSISGQKENIKDLLARVPVEERAAITEKLAQITEKHAGITGMNRNDFEKHYLLREFLENGYYGEAEKWVDDIVAVLDLFGLGVAHRAPDVDIDIENFFRGARRGPNVKGPFRTSSDLVVRENVEGQERLEAVIDLAEEAFEDVSGKMYPATPMSTAKDTNPGQSREIYDAAMEDESGQLSKVASGVDKVELATQVNMPKPRAADKSAESIPSDMEKNQRIRDEEAADIIGQAFKPTGIHYQDNEIKEASTRIFRKLSRVNGLWPRPAMSGYDNSRGFVDLTMVYGANPDSGFSTAKEALDVAEFNLREFGVTKDDLSLLIKDPVTNRYLPFDDVVTFGKTPLKGDFAIQLKYKYRYNPKDTDVFGSNAVGWKWADRVSGGRVMLSKYLADSSARFDRYIAQGGFRAVDKAFSLEKRLIDIFKKDFNALSGAEKVKILDIAKESNEKRVKFGITELKVKGLSQKEAEAVQKWYKYWDTIWEIDNRDLIRTLDTQGFQLFTNEKAGTKLFVKPVSRVEAAQTRLVYDPLDDSVRKLSIEEVQRLYAEGGTVARTKQTIQEHIGQTGKKAQIEAVNHVIARQDTDNVLRGLREDDVALSYIPGYYKVAYRDKYFIEETFTDVNGVEHKSVVGASSTSGGANVTARRLEGQSAEGFTYSVRRGRETRETNLFDQEEWEINVAQGRSSQRYRGQRLGDANGSFVEGEASILDPVEAAILSAKQLSQRVSMRDFIESMQQRWMNSFGDLSGNKMPDNVKKIQSTKLVDKDRVIEAKALYEYIQYMKQVSNSALDDGWKAVMMNLAEMMEGAGESKLMSTLAKAPRAVEDVSPTRALRTLPFVTYIAMNPLRQLIVQAHQVTQLMALNPKYMGTKFSSEMSAMFMAVAMDDIPRAAKMARVSEDEMKAMVKAWGDSGLPYSIDSNILIEGAQLQAVDHLSRSKIGRGVQAVTAIPKTAFGVSKKVGFDSGEYTNLLGAWLFSRNRAIEEGLDISNPEVLEKIAADAREISYGMNRAGAMAYNDGILGVFTQFLSVPHKAALSMIPGGNKALSGKERWRSAIFNAIMYGAPAGAVTAIMNELYKTTGEEAIDPELARKIDAGLEDTLLNALISSIAGRDVSINFEDSLAPGGATFFYELAARLMEDPFTFFPAGQLLFSDNSRLNVIMEDIHRIMTKSEEETLEKLWKSTQISAQFFSGFSNGFKAHYALKYHREFSFAGREMIGEVGTPEAVAFLLGFQRRGTGQFFNTLKSIKRSREDVANDVERYYFAVKREMLRGNREDARSFLEFSRAFWTTFDYDDEHHAFAVEEFARLARQDAANAPEQSLLNQLIRAADFTTQEEWDILIEQSPLNRETKDRARAIRDDAFIKEDFLDIEKLPERK